jgi:hypothetical protein
VDLGRRPGRTSEQFLDRAHIAARIRGRVPDYASIRQLVCFDSLSANIFDGHAGLFAAATIPFGVLMPQALQEGYEQLFNGERQKCQNSIIPSVG